MTKLDIPVEDNESVNSVSLSSNENGSASNRSMESSLSLGLGINPNSPPLANERQRQIYSPIAHLPNHICREPTLDAVLVIAGNHPQIK